MAMHVTVIDYGAGNLLSVTRALSHVGANPVQTNAPEAVANADRLVLPGVGAFGDGMAGLRAAGLVDAIDRYSERGRPFLGICLGMQMMLDSSEEFGDHAGLGLIAGKVVAIPPTGVDGTRHKIPHIGWSRLTAAADWRGTILDGLPQDVSTYFVHSFMAMPDDGSRRLADCDYDGRQVSGVIRRDNFYGCQFHPEKSGPSGLKILENFLKQ